MKAPAAMVMLNVQDHNNRPSPEKPPWLVPPQPMVPLMATAAAAKRSCGTWRSLRVAQHGKVTGHSVRCGWMNAVFFLKNTENNRKHMVTWCTKLLASRPVFFACRRKLLEDLMSRVCDLNACANASGKGRSDMTVNVLEAAADIFLQKDTGVGGK